jgi:hypothetical protein
MSRTTPFDLSFIPAEQLESNLAVALASIGQNLKHQKLQELAARIQGYPTLNHRPAAMHQEKPYLEETVVVKKYNPKYGDDRLCRCGHAYYRHFDSYDEMEPVGCKYCDCYEFVEAGQPLAAFRLPLRDGESRTVAVAHEANTIVLLGASGTGKSVLSLTLASQHLLDRSDAQLHWLSSIPWQDVADEIPQVCLAEEQMRLLMEQYQQRVVRHLFQAGDPLPGADAPPGSVVILDEMFDLRDRLPDLIAIARERQHVLLVCAQVPADVFVDSVPEGVGAILIGRMAGHPHASSPEVQKLLSALDQLVCMRGEHSEFIASTSDWLGIAKIPIPLIPAQD